MAKIAIIGGGITGISAGRLLEKHFEVTVYEKAPKIGGLIKCDDLNGNLFHRVGGHVFNTKVKEVADWFWSHFDREKDFIQAKRNAKILLNNQLIGYPLENYLYQIDPSLFEKIIEDLLAITRSQSKGNYDNFEDFLRGNFGNTLYNIYFGPYNKKIWRTELKEIPLEWLDGKLPMPNVKDIFYSNIRRAGEEGMVHATFYYPRKGGSQFIINTLSQGLPIKTGKPVTSIKETKDGFLVNHEQLFDKILYTGDVRELSTIYENPSEDLKNASQNVKDLKSNGTSNIFCETDANDISWLYLPDITRAHRIIYTGNFSDNNNLGSKRRTCVAEFSGKVSYEEMCEEVKLLPGNLTPISYNYEPNSYIIHDRSTKEKISRLKSILEPKGFYLAGRFAEWEYYNMDKAIEASMNIKTKLTTK